MADDTKRPETTSQLRDDIDRGGAGDKVAFEDPSAAPLGTDDEAAGTPPTKAQVDAAARAETHRAEPARTVKGPDDLQSPKASGSSHVGTWIAIAAAVIIIVVLALAFL
ncbi:hypothetical protein [Pseudoroseicyclus tamaricis]|uniref:Uncharacterized protein n=1 Tax=Pseudoroseicyclus tamaricis TaxID=2705421 RepID=A0A6B2JFI3_9RHOB|nr:hypothetical protein [Pseudoroseicyclus tamaricis]NDU99782.1 hypothetical protein [Pseudoroseicyclus tamaricis]